MEAPSEDVYSKHEANLLLLWLMKDCGWVLVVPYLCIPAGLTALGLSTYIVMQLKQAGGGVPFLRTGIELLWLLGNVMWMMADMLFDDLNYHYYLGYRMIPLIRDWDDAYDLCATFAMLFFAAGTIAYLLSYAKIIADNLSNPNSDREAWGLMSLADFRHSFIGWWILKDMLWIETRPEHVRPYILGLTFGLMAFVTVAEYVRMSVVRYPNFKGFELMLVELLWIAANMVWMTEEYVEQPLPHLRYLVGAILIVGAAITIRHTCVKDILLLGKVEGVGETESLIADQKKDTV